MSLVVLAFVALAALYSVFTPLGEGPDEPGHARYVFFLAREGRLPVRQADTGQSDVPGEGHQPPLAYALMAPVAAWLPREERQFDLPGNPRFTWAGGSELNAVAHGSREYMPWRGFVLAWHLARLVSVALGAATVVVTYLAAQALIDQKRKTKDQNVESSFVLGPWSFVPLLAAALVAFNPQFLFISALVTNDALLVTLSALLLWLALRRPMLGRDSGQATDDGRRSIRSIIVYAITMGAVLGLALITKQSAIILIPIAFFAVLEQSRLARIKRADGIGRPTSSARQLVTLSALLALGITTLLIGGWWYARNWLLYGDLFGLAAFQAEFITQPFEIANGAAWLAALGQLHDSFWARFGWMNVSPPSWVIWVFLAVEVVAVTGWLMYADERRKTKDEGSFFRPSSFVFRPGRWWPILALPLLAFGWIVSFALAAGLVAWQGRLLFPALPAIAIGLAVGIENVKLKTQKSVSRAVNFTFYILHFTLLALALWLPFGVIQSAYPFHTLPETVALERLGTEVYGRFGIPGEPGAELRGWSLSGTTRPGDTPELTLIWHARGRQNRNWTVFVHLVDAHERIVAQDNRPPQNDAFPMLQWVAGDWIEDRHPLALPASLAPGEYRIRAGLFYPRTDRRAGMYNQHGRLRGDYLDVGSMIVTEGGS